MRKTIYTLLSLILASTFILGACDKNDSEDTKSPSKDAVKDHKKELVYYEVLNNGDADNPKTDIAYRDKDSKKVQHYRPRLDYVYEHILDDGNEKPYVVKDGKKYFIYRPPYMNYGDDQTSGEVEDKSEVKK